MGQVRHGNARAMHAVRAATERSQASIAALSLDQNASGAEDILRIKRLLDVGHQLQLCC
jgi:hypothetical protein